MVLTGTCVYFYKEYVNFDRLFQLEGLIFCIISKWLLVAFKDNIYNVFIIYICYNN